MEVATIKEGALRVYSGQRLFPLTFQMPESGLALKDRRWHASMKGGDVRLGSIAATDLEVYTCGALALPCQMHTPESEQPCFINRWRRQALPQMLLVIPTACSVAVALRHS